jgi:2-polyprenyl-3-methyl-5-hydroxy-6-metoxy-1,4-benzoquinol methylase
MRLGAIPGNPVEWLALAAGLVPEPLVHTQFFYTQARAIMAAVEVGIFEALVEEPRTAQQVAKACNANERATRALLGALVGCDYLAFERASQRFRLRPIARKWLLRKSPHSLAYKMLFQRVEWRLIEGLESFVRTGQTVDLHLTSDSATWKSYQAGMADLGRLSLAEVISRTPVPKGARRMLDIGGSGGTYAGAFLRKYPALEARILDLPEAVVHARRFIDAQELGARLTIDSGNVLVDEIGEARYDFVFVSNLVHHFSSEQNLMMARKVHRALAPGGVFVIQDVERDDEPNPGNQIGALLDLYFALTSQSGTWSMAEMTGWMREAGFAALRPVRFRTAPGLVQAVGSKA